MADYEERLGKLKMLVESEKLECEIATLRDDHIGGFLKLICAKQTGGVILPAAAAALLGWRAPETVMEVFRVCRIGLIDGAMYLPFTEKTPAVTVDLVTAQWTAIAKRIADDLLGTEAFDDSETVIFEAQPHLRVHLSDFA